MTAKNKINFPSEEEIKKNFQELEDLDYQNNTFLITEEVSFLTQIKYEVCQNILRCQWKKQLGLKNLACLLDLEENKVKQLLNCQVWNFSLPELVDYSKKLHLDLRVKIINREQESTIG